MSRRGHKRIASNVNPKSSTPGINRKKDIAEKSKADLQAEFLALEKQLREMKIGGTSAPGTVVHKSGKHTQSVMTHMRGPAATPAITEKEMVQQTSRFPAKSRHFFDPETQELVQDRAKSSQRAASTLRSKQISHMRS